MGKTWILDTETKGTGAQMLPLEELVRRSEAPPRHVSTPPRPRSHSAPIRSPRQPRRFRVVDVVSGQLLADGADVRATVDVLRGVRSIVDVSVHVWEEDGQRWRSLSLDERRALWNARRARSGPATAADAPEGPVS